MNRRNTLILAVAVIFYATAILLMRFSMPDNVYHAEVRFVSPERIECQGRVWTSREAPKAVIVIGHGVTENQGVMATVAKAYAAAGYAAYAIDFYGHGRSQKGFDWMGNPAQVLAWCQWVRVEYPDLPIAYLGHSMGGFAGSEAFQKDPPVQAFVSLGAMPRAFPPVKTLVAAGQFEELFTPEEAREKTAGKAEVLISPWSNHALEPWDPVLAHGMVQWVDAALGVETRGSYPWTSWSMAMLATVLGTASLLLGAGQVILLLAVKPGESAPPRSDRRRWPNPYRFAARLLGPAQDDALPRAAQPLQAVLAALLFVALLIAGLSLLLSRDIFTANLDHPPRWLGWGVATLVLLLHCWLGSIAIERAGAGNALRRFLLGVVTRGIPLLALSVAIRLLLPKAAFGAMMLGIFGLIAIVLAAIYALSVRGARDHRAGALATAMIFAWVMSFWFPLTW